MGVDLAALGKTNSTDQRLQTNNNKTASSTLQLDDFLQLIVAQFQNQDPENAASTTDMMNTLVQMSVVQAISTVTDAATMLYSSSLVGKEVTVGQIKNGKLEEIVGTVTATGTYGGQPVIFLDGVSYKISDIMAVGRLPAKPVDPETPPETDDKPPETDDKPPATDDKPPETGDKPPETGGETGNNGNSSSTNTGAG